MPGGWNGHQLPPLSKVVNAVPPSSHITELPSSDTHMILTPSYHHILFAFWGVNLLLWCGVVTQQEDRVCFGVCSWVTSNGVRSKWFFASSETFRRIVKDDQSQSIMMRSKRTITGRKKRGVGRFERVRYVRFSDNTPFSSRKTSRSKGQGDKAKRRRKESTIHQKTSRDEILESVFSGS